MIKFSELVTSDPLTKSDLIEIGKRMHDVVEETYWTFFRAGMGAHCHAFLEFNGLISKYAQICERAAERGIDFTQASVVSEDDTAYYALPVDNENVIEPLKYPKVAWKTRTLEAVRDRFGLAQEKDLRE